MHMGRAPRLHPFVQISGHTRIKGGMLARPPALPGGECSNCFELRECTGRARCLHATVELRQHRRLPYQPPEQPSSRHALRIDILVALLVFELACMPSCTM